MDNVNGLEVTMETLRVGDKKAFCRCLQSSEFPYCDGTHQTVGDVKPIVINIEDAQE